MKGDLPVFKLLPDGSVITPPVPVHPGNSFLQFARQAGHPVDHSPPGPYLYVEVDPLQKALENAPFSVTARKGSLRFSLQREVSCFSESDLSRMYGHLPEYFERIDTDNGPFYLRSVPNREKSIYFTMGFTNPDIHLEGRGDPEGEDCRPSLLRLDGRA